MDSGGAGSFSYLGPLIQVLKALKLIHMLIVIISIAEKCLNCMIDLDYISGSKFNSISNSIKFLKIEKKYPTSVESVDPTYQFTISISSLMEGSEPEPTQVISCTFQRN